MRQKIMSMVGLLVGVLLFASSFLSVSADEIGAEIIQSAGGIVYLNDCTGGILWLEGTDERQLYVDAGETVRVLIMPEENWKITETVVAFLDDTLYVDDHTGLSVFDFVMPEKDVYVRSTFDLVKIELSSEGEDTVETAEIPETNKLPSETNEETASVQATVTEADQVDAIVMNQNDIESNDTIVDEDASSDNVSINTPEGDTIDKKLSDDQILDDDTLSYDDLLDDDNKLDGDVLNDVSVTESLTEETLGADEVKADVIINPESQIVTEVEELAWISDCDKETQQDDVEIVTIVNGEPVEENVEEILELGAGSNCSHTYTKTTVQEGDKIKTTYTCSKCKESYIVTDHTGVLLPTAVDNLCDTLRTNSSLTAEEQKYMRVFFDGSQVGIEYYDSGFSILSKKNISLELPVWGGFYSGADAYYLIEGKHNKEENNNAEVLRVIKYDKDWNRIGAAYITGNSSLFGGQVGYIFDCGCVDTTEYNGVLYIVTGHEGYVDPAVGQGHQGYLMFAVDEASMTGSIVDADLWHSFAQYIENDGSVLYVLEQSEGSRCTKLSKYNVGNYNETSLEVLGYGGTRDSAWALPCYASVDDLVLSGSSILGVGTSIDQSEYASVDSNTAHNIYITVTPKGNFSENETKIKWITNYTGDGKSFLQVSLTKINDNRFLLMWEEDDNTQTSSINDTLTAYQTYYLFLDGEGNTISQKYRASAALSDCHPILNGNKVVYYSSSSNMVDFYSVDTSTGVFNKTCYRIAGDHATWSIDNGTLTVSGQGTVYVDGATNTRYPLSSTKSVYIIYDADNSWKTVRDSVNELVVGEGIKVISSSSFQNFTNLSTVKLPESLTEIGARAFFGCGQIGNIYIPQSVSKIGEDVFWTGFYLSDSSHLVYATILGRNGSNAIDYAKRNNIRYAIVPNNGGWQQILFNWYYLDAKGNFTTGWQRIGGNWYYMGNDGAMRTGWQNVNGKWYYLNSNGAMTTGWQKINGKWYYLGTNGVMLTGWQRIAGNWYYMANSGVMQTGWQKIGGKWYYLNTNGAMKAGWQNVSGKWYYLGTDGVMQTGWVKLSGEWYYLASNGAMATSWQKVNGNWYYFGTNGTMTTGWQKVGNKWYYLSNSGVMQTGWVMLSGRWYYLNSDGAMLTGTQTIDGKTYRFNSDGAWVA